MNRKSRNCEICLNPLLFTAYAVVSPWIRSLGVRGKRLSKYMTCGKCMSGFFDFRYSNDDMAKIYKNYRGEEYLSARGRWEPWYSRSFNEEHDSTEFISMRRGSLYKFLYKHLDREPKIVVDFGGDRGQYIPNLGQIEAYVVEASSKKLVTGVNRLSSLNQISKAGLILYCHVLEHVANPKQEVEKLIQHCDQLYIEVPFGTPKISKTRESKTKLLLKLFASLSPTIWRRSTMPATGRFPKQDVLVQSEHINFFREESLHKLAEILNLEAHIEVNSIKTPDRAEAKVIQCLLIPRKEKEI